MKQVKKLDEKAILSRLSRDCRLILSVVDA